MFRETKKFFGPQLTHDLRSGINIPSGLATAVDRDQNFSYSFGAVGDVMLRDGEQIPLFANPINIAADAVNATSIAQVVSIATNSLINNQQLNRCEQNLPFEQSLYYSSFRRATASSTTVLEAIQSCTDELSKIYTSIIIDSNRMVFEIDAISARNFPLGDYTYQDDVNISMKKGVIYASSVNDENLDPITVPLTGVYHAFIDASGNDLVILSDNTIRYFTRWYEKPMISTTPLGMTIPLTGGTYQSVVQRAAFPRTRLFSCNTTTLKIVEVSTVAPVGSVISNSAIDTKANNNLPIIGIVNLIPQVMDTSYLVVNFGFTQVLVIAQQGENAIVAMEEGGGPLLGWTYFPHPIVGISRESVALGSVGAGTDMTVLYENPSGPDGDNLASRVLFSDKDIAISSICSIDASVGGIWSFLTDGTQFSFSNGISGFATQAGGGLETRNAILFDTSILNDSRVTVLKVRICAAKSAIPFSRNLNTGALLPCTVNVYSFTPATPGVIVNSDLTTGPGALLGSFVIPYTNTDNSGISHPPADTDGQVRGEWSFDLPLANLNTTGFTGIFVKLTGFTPTGSHTIGGGVANTLKLITVGSSDISSTTPTTFLSHFPADGTFRYEERTFLGYFLDKQQEFVVPIKGIKQFCNFQSNLSNRPKVRAFGVEFPRLSYVNNSKAKTSNGSTYVTNSYSSPYLTSGYSMKVGEFYDSRNGSTLTTKTKRLLLTFDRLNYWYHSMRLINGKCKLQIHIQSYTSRLIDNSNTIRVINNPNKFSLLVYLSGTFPENTIKVINGGTIFKSLPRDMSLDTDGDGVVTEADLGRNYIVEFDVTDFIIELRKTRFSSAAFIFRNENESQFFNLASGNDTIIGGEISSTVEIFDEYAPRLIFTDEFGELLIKKNGYKSLSMPRLTTSIVI